MNADNTFLIAENIGLEQYVLSALTLICQHQNIGITSGKNRNDQWLTRANV